MKMRVLKRHHQNRAIYNNRWQSWRAARSIVVHAGAPSYMAHNRDFEFSAPGDLAAADQEFVCMRVRDSVVVDTFDTREEALALVVKHARQKKAKLQVLDSATGELVLFSEEEMAS